MEPTAAQSVDAYYADILDIPAFRDSRPARYASTGKQISRLQNPAARVIDDPNVLYMDSFFNNSPYVLDFEESGGPLFTDSGNRSALDTRRPSRNVPGASILEVWAGEMRALSNKEMSGAPLSGDEQDLLRTYQDYFTGRTGMAEGGVVSPYEQVSGGFDYMSGTPGGSRVKNASGSLTVSGGIGSITPGFTYSEERSRRGYPDGIVVDEFGRRIGISLNGELFLDEGAGNRLRAGVSRDTMSGGYRATSGEDVLGEDAYKQALERYSLGADFGPVSFDVQKAGDDVSGRAAYRPGENMEFSVEDSNRGDPTFGFQFAKRFNDGGVVVPPADPRFEQKGIFGLLGDVLGITTPPAGAPITAARQEAIRDSSSTEYMNRADFYDPGTANFGERLMLEYGYPGEYDPETNREIFDMAFGGRHATVLPPDRPDMPQPQELRDARQHMLGTALAARGYGEGIAGFMGSVNEFLGSGTPADIAMDTRNNAVGLDLLRQAGIEATPQQLTRLVDDAIFKQLDRIMSRTPQERYNGRSPAGGPDLYLPRDERGRIVTTQ